MPKLLPPHLLLASQAASKYATGRAREGKWPHIRTVPRQFPPWPSTPPPEDQGGIWGVQHLLHPDMPVRDTFAEVYFSSVILDVVKQLLGVEPGEKGDDKLVMELFNLLVSPSGGKDFELSWHRDDIRPEVSVEEEEKQLADKSPDGRQLHAQYNIALVDDDSLVVIPGSHRRPRTEIERNADPYEPELPGQVVVHLGPGDAVFYDSNIIHRGIYRGVDTQSEIGRMTLHGSVGLAGFGKERARQVLQHSVGEWVERAQFRADGQNGPRAEAMRRRLMAMGKGDDLGYSLDG